MKIRQGFVSNSSSSSFVLIGVEIDKDDYSREEFIKDVGASNKRPYPEDALYGENKYNLVYRDNTEQGTRSDETCLIGESFDIEYDTEVFKAEKVSEIINRIHEVCKSMKNKEKASGAVFFGKMMT